ncbi:MAG: hypothetical protein PHW46_02870 [Candidatus Omnitrophica bacterium]|nr:hypothetical protein [Candidatus Omnitrophota bacterium]
MVMIKKPFIKKNSVLCLFAFLFSLFYNANASHAGFEGDAYRSSYVCTDLKGKQRWQASVEIRHKEGNVYSIVEKMNGQYSGFDGNISWVARTDFERNKESVKPLNMDQQIFDQSGKLIVVNKQDFDYTKKIVICTHKDLIENTTSTKEFAFSKEIINRLLQGLYVQKFIENGITRKEMQVISPEPALYNIELKVIGTEPIEINGRTRNAYKLAFDPQLGLLNFVKTFLPKAYVWHSSEPIFEWLKYRGLESSVSSPQVEIISLDEDVTEPVPGPVAPANNNNTGQQ